MGFCIENKIVVQTVESAYLTGIFPFPDAHKTLTHLIVLMPI